MKVMHERNAHKFPLDLGSESIFPIALNSSALVG